MEMPALREVIKVDEVYYVEVDIVLKERARFYLWAKINQEGKAIMECEHCGKDIILKNLEEIDRLNRFLLCDECVRKGKGDVIIDEFQVKKSFDTAYGAIDPEMYPFIGGRRKEETLH